MWGSISISGLSNKEDNGNGKSNRENCWLEIDGSSFSLRVGGERTWGNLLSMFLLKKRGKD